MCDIGCDLGAMGCAYYPPQLLLGLLDTEIFKNISEDLAAMNIDYVPTNKEDIIGLLQTGSRDKFLVDIVYKLLSYHLKKKWSQYKKNISCGID